MKNTLEDFCRNVHYLRKKNGLTQKETAKLLHIGVESLRKIEAGELPPRLGVEVLFYAQTAFSVPFSRLLAHIEQEDGTAAP